MSEQFCIAIDGGGTGTRIGLYDETRTLVSETTGPATNPYQVPPETAAERLSALAASLLPDESNVPVAIVAGISGARDQATREIFARTLCARVPRVERVGVTTDVHAHLIANAERRASALVIAGTGSSVAVLDANREVSIFGGRGPLLGDDGSAYDVAVSALRVAFAAKDKEESSPELLVALVRAAELTSCDDLVGWCANAEKPQIARLAETVLECADNDDPRATWCLINCAKALGRVVSDAIHRTQLGLTAPVFIMGGLFEKSYLYRDLFQRSLRALGIENELKVAPLIGHRAVFALTEGYHLPESVPYAEMTPLTLSMSDVDEIAVHDDENAPLDSLNTSILVDRMERADTAAAQAAQSCNVELALLINRVANAFRHGGRLIYIGAGTSGRIGVLDASECPPTFGVPAGQVIGIIAGGDRALRESIEGAEDDIELGRADIDAIEPPIGKDDVVVGIAASGTTPYTLAAVAAAKSLGARTALVCCNSSAKAEVDHLLVLPTGPEVLPGSTRLKAGTATKMVLNAITTGAMALSGRVFEGYMIGVQPTNAKLRKRAAYIISALTGIDNGEAARRLEKAGNNVAAAVMMERLKISAKEALALLEKTHGDVRAAIALHKSGDTA